MGKNRSKHSSTRSQSRRAGALQAKWERQAGGRENAFRGSSTPKLLSPVLYDAPSKWSRIETELKVLTRYNTYHLARFGVRGAGRWWQRPKKKPVGLVLTHRFGSYSIEDPSCHEALRRNWNYRSQRRITWIDIREKRVIVFTRRIFDREAIIRNGE